MSDDHKNASTEAQHVKMLAGLVKTLVWERHPCGWIAAPPTGRAYIIDTRTKGKFEVIKGLTFPANFNTLEAAKAAAQADYTARILAAIDTDAIAALVGALTRLRDLMCEAFEDDDGNSGCGQCESDCTGCIAHTALTRLGGGE